MWNVWRPKLCGIADLFDLTKHTQTKPLHTRPTDIHESETYMQITTTGDI